MSVAEIKVSVIMPSLNVVGYIEECMDSVINQTLENMEIICIDAGSTDGTWEILNHYKKIYGSRKKIRLYNSDVKSYGYQVNLGIKLSQGEYVAVMETDDFADLHMYEELFKIGHKYNLDIVKADCEWFYLLRNGKRYYETWKLWNGQNNKYNVIFEPCMDEYLYENDYNLWRGIYKREFLITNNLWLSETDGAAFQDIGFGIQVLACAGRVYYSDKSFYRYRRDREDASAGSLYGLQYAQYEFERMLKDAYIWNNLKCKQGFYRRMAGSFKGEYDKILQITGFDVDSIYLSQYYKWFCKILKQAIKEEVYNLDYMQDDNRKEFMFFLNDNRKYVEEVQKKYDMYKKKVTPYLNIIGKRDVVIFGAGNWGRTLLRQLLHERIKPIFIFDNNQKLWGERILDVQIKEPECIADDQCVLIACKIHGIEIAKQLKKVGIKENQIIFWKE